MSDTTELEGAVVVTYLVGNLVLSTTLAGDL